VRDEGGEKLNPLDLLRKRFKQLIYKKTNLVFGFIGLIRIEG